MVYEQLFCLLLLFVICLAYGDTPGVDDHPNDGSRLDDVEIDFLGI